MNKIWGVFLYVCCFPWLLIADALKIVFYFMCLILPLIVITIIVGEFHENIIVSLFYFFVLLPLSFAGIIAYFLEESPDFKYWCFLEGWKDLVLNSSEGCQ